MMRTLQQLGLCFLLTLWSYAVQAAETPSTSFAVKPERAHARTAWQEQTQGAAAMSRAMVRPAQWKCSADQIMNTPTMHNA